MALPDGSAALPDAASTVAIASLEATAASPVTTLPDGTVASPDGNEVVPDAGGSAALPEAIAELIAAGWLGMNAVLRIASVLAATLARSSGLPTG